MNWPTPQQAAAMSPQRAAAAIRLHEALARDAVDLAGSFQRQAERLLAEPLPASRNRRLLTQQAQVKSDAKHFRRLVRHHQDRAVHHHGIVERIRKAQP